MSISLKTEENRPKILVILGPTASGKSELAVKIARKYNGEIISADSRQVYKGLDIGSGKVPRDKSNDRPTPHSLLPTPYLYKGILHHLLDVASPKRTFTVVQFQKLGYAAIKKIFAKGKLPIICGGTGLYIDALLNDAQFPNVKPNQKLRRALERHSAKTLFEKLKKLDPHRAMAIDRHNKHRLIRAIEIVATTGNIVPPLPSKKAYSNVLENIGISHKSVIKIGLKMVPEELKKRIHARLVRRLREGMIEEIAQLRKNGLSWKRLDDLGMEYRFVSRFVRGLITKQEMQDAIERESSRYAKRQMTWWKRDKNIAWFKNARAAEKTARIVLTSHHRL